MNTYTEKSYDIKKYVYQLDALGYKERDIINVLCEKYNTSLELLEIILASQTGKILLIDNG